MSSEKNPDTRHRILNSTWKLLEEGKGNEVRMSDIAREVGISRQALYLHFPKRADLLIATTRHIDAVKDVDAMLVASRSARTGLERLDAYVEAWGNYIPQIHGVAKALISMQDQDEAARLAWSDRLQAVRHGCAAAVDALARDGKLSPDLTNDKATDLLWTILSVENWEHLTRTCAWPQDEYIATIKALARGALLSKTS